MNERLINRMVLNLFNDLRGIPQALADVEYHLVARTQDPTARALAARSLQYLDAAGYIAHCEATAADTSLWKITANGIRMAEKQVPAAELDPMIHGA